jgi:hypothetical protein
VVSSIPRNEQGSGGAGAALPFRNT